MPNNDETQLSFRLSEAELMIDGLTLLPPERQSNVIYNELIKKLTLIKSAWKKAEEARIFIRKSAAKKPPQPIKQQQNTSIQPPPSIKIINKKPLTKKPLINITQKPTIRPPTKQLKK